jgi:purine-binding chemotaxis protein CheW
MTDTVIDNATNNVTKTINVLTLRIGTQWYGVNIDHVAEVLYMVQLAEVPTVPGVLGLLTAREAVLPVLDLRLQFGVENPEIHLNTPIILVNLPRERMGVVVDEVDTVVQIAQQDIVPQERLDTLPIEGVVRLSDRLLMVIDVSMLEVHANA